MAKWPTSDSPAVHRIFPWSSQTAIVVLFKGVLRALSRLLYAFLLLSTVVSLKDFEHLTWKSLNYCLNGLLTIAQRSHQMQLAVHAFRRFRARVAATLAEGCGPRLTLSPFGASFSVSDSVRYAGCCPDFQWPAAPVLLWATFMCIFC